VYYFAFSYSIIAGYLGIEVPLVAAGLTAFLAGFCFYKLWSRRWEVYTPIALLFACQISLLLVQFVIYDVSPMSDSLRWFVLWIFGMVIVQALCLRPGFLHRFTIVIFALGLIAVPHLAFTTDVVERARADIEIGGGLRNANGLGVWFGFCAVSLGIFGLQTKRGIIVRLLYWIAAVVSLIVVGLSVSRGALFGCALALAVGLRHLLKRGFAPVLLLIILSGIILESGWYDQIVTGYEARLTEETGRFLLWPHVVERILASPLVGVGVSQIDTYSPEIGHSISTPHNSFLFFALSSGILPFAFFVSFWIRAAWGSFWDDGQSEYSPFRIPLFLYALVSFTIADISAEPWGLLVLAVAAGIPISHLRDRRFFFYRTRERGLAAIQLPPNTKPLH